MQFVFANHALDIDRRELRRGSDAIAVEPQVFDLLVYDAPTKFIQKCLFLHQAPFNEATLFGSQVCSQNLSVPLDVRPASELRRSF